MAFAVWYQFGIHAGISKPNAFYYRGGDDCDSEAPQFTGDFFVAHAVGDCRGLFEARSAAGSFLGRADDGRLRPIDLLPHSGISLLDRVFSDVFRGVGSAENGPFCRCASGNGSMGMDKKHAEQIKPASVLCAGGIRAGWRGSGFSRAHTIPAQGISGNVSCALPAP